ncbi:MAG: hypothetical protein M9949_12305 [Candidatus Kapabacteria bacterium]|nr:hypothetical protein [Candidatus Kapabacteria bacterium]
MKQCTFLAAILFCITSSFSQIPQTISWQGILQDADSKNLSGTFSLTVKLYDVASGGTAIWNETHSNVAVADGLVNLSSWKRYTFSINFGDEYWLGNHRWERNLFRGLNFHLPFTAFKNGSLQRN